MLGLDRPAKVFLYAMPCDMRKGFNGLFGLVRQDMGLDPISGHLYVFINGGRNLIKVLYWDGDGEKAQEKEKRSEVIIVVDWTKKLG